MHWLYKEDLRKKSWVNLYDEGWDWTVEEGWSLGGWENIGGHWKIKR
jgi:hypothetical protein